MSDRLAQTYVLPPPSVASIAVADEAARFPVRRIFCVGRNYAEHACEMGHDPDREPPFFFMKPADAVVDDGARVPYPPLTRSLHHEIELVVAIGMGGADIAAERALHHVFGYAAGIDLTRRDLQQTAKDMRRPWDWAKGFDRSAPIGALRRVSEIGHPARGRIQLAVNGAMRQDFGHRRTDLERARDHRLSFEFSDAATGRSRDDRHAGRRRPVGQRRSGRWRRRRGRRDRDRDRLGVDT